MISVISMTQEILNIQGFTESGEKSSSLEYYHETPFTGVSKDKFEVSDNNLWVNNTNLGSPMKSLGYIKWQPWGLRCDGCGGLRSDGCGGLRLDGCGGLRSDGCELGSLMKGGFLQCSNDHDFFPDQYHQTLKKLIFYWNFICYGKVSLGVWFRTGVWVPTPGDTRWKPLWVYYWNFSL